MHKAAAEMLERESPEKDSYSFREIAVTSNSFWLTLLQSKTEHEFNATHACLFIYLPQFDGIDSSLRSRDNLGLPSSFVHPILSALNTPSLIKLSGK